MTGQTVYLRGARDEPLGGGADDEHFKDEQPSAVNERGNVCWGWVAVRPGPAGWAC